ncbi:phosphoribosyltransferase family protein [Cryptosporangium minutisporangium]|uniref:phosphoribosyltransferase family protein n=1 Tax=Cryptosporangium minutisporangium TaxID=113569 RepID=UPI0031E8B965
MTNQGRGQRPKADADRELQIDLRAAFRWRSDRTDDQEMADPTGWWADPIILSRLGPALAASFADQRPTIVLGLQSRGSLLGALVALHLQVGLVEIRKDPRPSTDSDRWLTTRTAPDYRDRHLELGVRRDHLNAGQRALLVDDWIETGGQARAARTLVEAAGARWCGAAVIVDGLHNSRLRRDLHVRSLLNIRDL